MSAIFSWGSRKLSNVTGAKLSYHTRPHLAKFVITVRPLPQNIHRDSHFITCLVGADVDSDYIGYDSKLVILTGK